MKIRIVGSPSSDSQSLEKLLSERGHAVDRSACGSVQDPVAGADVIILDLDSDASAMLSELRRLSAPSVRPLLIACGSASSLEVAIAAGADDVIEAGASERMVAARVALFERRAEEARRHREQDEALQAAHANLLSLIENTDDFVLFSDRTGAPVFFNSAYAGVMKAALDLDMKPGIKPHELLEDPAQRAVWDDYHARVLGGERFTVEHRHAFADGREVCLEVRYNPVRREGEIIGFSEFSRDVTQKKQAERDLEEARSQLEAKVAERTAELAASNLALQEENNERRRAEEALRASEHRYRTVFDTAPIAFVLWDTDGRVVDWNRRAEEMFGYMRDEVLGRSYVDLIVAQGQRERAELNRRRVLDGRIPARSTDENITRSGQRILCEWSRARLFDADGQVVGVMSLGLDVTEQRKMEERLRRSEKMEAIGQLAGGIAHDFNNQLVGVMGYADMLKRSLADEKQVDYANNILKSARRSAELIAQLLAFARKGKYMSTPVDLHTVIAEVIALLERSIDKRIVIEKRLDALGAVTLGDPTQIQNALLNLALNARDAMPDGGTLTFATDVEVVGEARLKGHADDVSPGPYVRVRVCDTGIGMERSTVDRIFEPFFTTKRKGTGMGLAAVYGTVRSHRGLIQVDTAPGKGTTFEILFRQHEGAEEDTAESYRLHQPSAAAHVLVVDDEEMVCALAADMIRALGHRVTTSSNGADALRRYAASWRDIDVVIFDMVMPKMSGRELLDELRAINPEVKAVLSSGYAIDDRARAILDSGVRGFLQKPYDLSALARIIRELMGDG